MVTQGEAITGQIIRSLTDEQLENELASRGKLFVYGPESGPDEAFFTNHRCASCRYFNCLSSYKSGRGSCAIRAPHSGGFPEVKGSSWCGEWTERHASQIEPGSPPIESVTNTEAVAHMLIAFDLIEQLARSRLPNARRLVNPLGRTHQTMADDSRRILDIIERAKRCGLMPEELEALRELIDCPFPFEIENDLAVLAKP